MKINPSFSAFEISASGMGAQKKKMNLVAENIANTDTTRTKDGTPYKKKYLVVQQAKSFNNNLRLEGGKLNLEVSQPGHISSPQIVMQNGEKTSGLSTEVASDNSQGELVYMPDHPDANKDGYVQMPNISVVTEMVDMIAASRSYEANLTAFNSSKQIAKDALQI